MDTRRAPHESGGLFVKGIESPDSGVMGQEFLLDHKRLTFGRAEDCGVVVNDPTVSRLHAELRADGERILLLDCGSANGVWLGESRVDRIELGLGVRFRIGASIFEIVKKDVEPQDEEPAPVPVPASESDWKTVVTAEPLPLPHEGPQVEGKAILVRGNRPFLLDDAEFCWIVEAGRVEVFGVKVAEGKPMGVRRHYLSVQPGDAVFGMDLDGYEEDSGFFAVGRAGTLLRKIRLSQLQALAAGAEGTYTARIVDNWIAGMSKSLVRDLSRRPRVDQSVFDGIEVTLGTDQRLSSAKDVLWLEGERLRLLFLGIEAVECSPDRFFPVTPDTWVESLAEPEHPFSVHTRSTGELIAEPALWRGLDDFHRGLCRCDSLIQRLNLVDEFNRLATKAEYSAAAARAGHEQLVAVMEPALAEREQVAADPGDALLMAVQRIGGAMGAEIRSHPELSPGMSYSDRLSRIAKASNLRTRQVALRDAWWRADQGPILARWAENEEPVALLPKGSRAYEYFDPAEGRRRRVDAKMADRLAPFAHVLYPPLPAKAVNVTDLLLFGLRGFGKDLRVLVAMGLALGILGALAPFFTGRVFDSAIPEAERSLLFQYGFVLVVAAIASAAFKLTQAVAVMRIEGRIDYALEAAVWDRLLNLPSTFFRQYSAGDLGERAAGISAIRHALAGAGVSSILGVFSSIFFVGLMLWYDLKLGAVAIVLCFLFVAATTAINLLQLRTQREELNVRGRISGLVLQIVAGIGKIRVAGAENHAFHVWADQFADQRRKSFRTGRLRNVLAMINSAFPILASLVLFWVVASSVEKRAAGESRVMSTGEFIGFFAAFAQFLGAMQALADASLNLLRVVPLYERLRPILTAAPESEEGKAYPGRLKGGVELSHIHFRYSEDGPWVLRDVTLTIRPGEFIAFVGASGSGKSTLMRLMLGFEMPQRGSIYFDGQDLRNLDLREFRHQLGVVLQESMVLPADLYRNIVGSSSRTIEEAWEAARQAGLDRDVQEMPMGIHTYVSEGGGGLSGGQRQRLLIARAVVGKPRILLMDEATSALDNRAQATVTESLARLESTRVIIAHRLSTIVNADRICVFDNGVIAEEGTYEQLMQKGGLFAQLAQRQMA